MKEIGGYFELELPQVQPMLIKQDWVKLNSGRHALEYILRNLQPKARLIYLPLYTCEVVLEPIIRLGIPYQFYHIDENLEIEHLPCLKQGEYIIVNNYFGIKDSYINSLFSRYKSQMIVDDAQALFHEPLEGMRAFYSPRKFVGVPDGGFAKTLETCPDIIEQDFSTDRAIHLLRRIDAGAQAGFDEFRKNDLLISDIPLRTMSNLTIKLLNAIDFNQIKRQRNINFSKLHLRLRDTNKFNIPAFTKFACPMIYPYLNRDLSVRQRLIDQKIYVATYWPGVNQNLLNSTEKNILKNLVPIPIDQRYNDFDLNKVVRQILQNE